MTTPFKDHLKFQNKFLTSLYPSSSGTIWMSTLFILLPCLIVGKQTVGNQAEACWSGPGADWTSMTKSASFWASCNKPKRQNPPEPLTRQETVSLWWSDRLFFLPTPWQPGPWSNYWPNKVSAGHLWCTAVIKSSAMERKFSNGPSNVIRWPLSSIVCWDVGNYSRNKSQYQ